MSETILTRTQSLAKSLKYDTVDYIFSEKDDNCNVSNVKMTSIYFTFNILYTSVSECIISTVSKMSHTCLTMTVNNNCNIYNTELKTYTKRGNIWLMILNCSDI